VLYLPTLANNYISYTLTEASYSTHCFAGFSWNLKPIPLYMPLIIDKLQWKQLGTSMEQLSFRSIIKDGVAVIYLPLREHNMNKGLPKLVFNCWSQTLAWATEEWNGVTYSLENTCNMNVRCYLCINPFMVATAILLITLIKHSLNTISMCLYWYCAYHDALIMPTEIPFLW